MKILVGADPEVFVENKDGCLINAHDMVKGTKAMPLPVPYGAVQVDGMALEFNIDPAETMQDFVRNITMVKQRLHEMIGIDQYNLLSSPSVFFTDKDMETANPLSLVLGCDPDFNAWFEGQANLAPDPMTNMRTGAGHIHIGWGDGFSPEDTEHTYDCIDLTKQLDCSLGVQSILWDNDKDRRKLYGKAGAFRQKPYGVEYRVLSNAWLRSEELMAHIFKVTVKATSDYFNKIHYFTNINAAQIINQADTDMARVINETLSARWNVPRWEGSYV